MTRKIAGLTAAIPDPDYDLIKKAGVEWLRFGFPLPSPTEDARSEQRLQERLTKARKLKDVGFQLLGSSPGPGSMRYDRTTGTTRWHSSVPDSAGPVGSAEYFDSVRAACKRLAAATGELVGLWQVANEPDISIFRGPLSAEQMLRFLREAARGIKEGNPAQPCLHRCRYGRDHGYQCRRNNEQPRQGSPAQSGCPRR